VIAQLNLRSCGRILFKSVIRQLEVYTMAHALQA